MHFAFLFPRFKILSGAERLILKLAESLVEKGHQVTVLCHQFDDSCSAILSQKVSLKVSGLRMDFFRNRYLNAAFDYFRSSALAGMLQGKVDAACCFGPALPASQELIKREQFPVFYFCYEPPRFLYTDREVIRKQLPLPGILAEPVFSFYKNRDQRFVRMVHKILSNSNFGAKQIQEIYGIEAHVITHGLDPFQMSNHRNELRARLGFQNSDILVLTVNYLHPRKRIELFLETLAEANKENSSVKGLIVGDGPEKPKLLRHKHSNLSVFAGFIPEPELYHYYQAADIYLHTGRLETFGLSVIEASANALPVVSVNEGGPCETVMDNQTGFLEDANSEKLALSLLKLAGDPELRDNFGKAGQIKVRGRYSWAQGAQDFLNALNVLI